MRTNGSAARSPARSASARALGVELGREGAALFVGSFVDRHRRPPLASMGEQCLDLAIDVAVDVLDVVDVSGLETQQRRRAVRPDSLLGIEVRIARGDDPGGDEQPGVVMVRVDPVGLPRIVSEHDIGTGLTNDPARGGDRRSVTSELAVDVAQEDDVGRAEDRGGIPLLLLASGGQRAEIGVAVPGPLGTVRAYAHRHAGTCRGPLRERRTAPELDVVGVRADREHALRYAEVDGRGHDVGVRRSASSSVRSAARSTSKASDGSCTILTESPRRRASSAWRAAESGP